MPLVFLLSASHPWLARLLVKLLEIAQLGFCADGSANAVEVVLRTNLRSRSACRLRRSRSDFSSLAQQRSSRGVRSSIASAARSQDNEVRNLRCLLNGARASSSFAMRRRADALPQPADLGRSAAGLRTLCVPSPVDEASLEHRRLPERRCSSSAPAQLLFLPALDLAR